MEVEEIKHNNKTLAIIFRGTARIHGVEFLTPKNYPLQLGAQLRKKGDIIPPHVHNPIPRRIETTQEMIHVDSGKILIEFYESKKRIKEVTMNSGDTILLVRGGHGIKVLKKTKIIEVKQGPYSSKKQDKELIMIK